MFVYVSGQCKSMRTCVSVCVFDFDWWPGFLYTIYLYNMLRKRTDTYNSCACVCLCVSVNVSVSECVAFHTVLKFNCYLQNNKRPTSPRGCPIVDRIGFSLTCVSLICAAFRCVVLLFFFFPLFISPTVCVCVRFTSNFVVLRHQEQCYSYFCC